TSTPRAGMRPGAFSVPACLVASLTGPRRPPRPRGPPASADFAQRPVRDVVDEAPDHGPVGEEGIGLDPRERLAHVRLRIAEGLGRPARAHPGIGLDLRLELVVAEGEHPAVGVVDADDLLRAEPSRAGGPRPG